MNSPRIQSIDTANTAEEMLEPSSQGTYKVFNRILDWITNDWMRVESCVAGATWPV